MKHFEYRILIDEVNIHNARRWCRENFGELGAIPLSYKSKRPWIVFAKVYDVENNRWHHKMTDTKKNNSRAFYFKNGTDAMAFKLRWI